MAAAQTIPAGQFTFDPVAHAYILDGRQIPSVTQAIKEAGLISFDFVAEDVLARKAQLGRLVHQACHFYDENDLDENALEAMSPEVFARFSAYKRFRQETGYKPVVNEYQQVAVLHGMPYGMQFDSTGLIGDVPYLIDIKNAAAESPSWGVQLAAYECGIDKPLPYRNYQRAAVQLRADGTYRFQTYKEPSDAQIWMACLALAHWKRNKKIVK